MTVKAVLAGRPTLALVEMTETRHSHPAAAPAAWPDGGSSAEDAPAATRGGRSGRSDLTAGGTEGNELLTVQVGAVLFVLLAVLGITIVRIGQLIWLHLFLGLLLLGPVALKLASTGYRFVRYYTANPAYRRKGAPPRFLRLLGPVVVLSTLVVFASGVALLALGPSSRGSLLLTHKASFFVWLAAIAVHVLGHMPEISAWLFGGRQVRGEIFSLVRGEAPAPRGSALPRDGHRPGARLTAAVRLPGGTGRAASIAAALAGGLILALALIPHFGPWLHYHHFRHDH